MRDEELSDYLMRRALILADGTQPRPGDRVRIVHTGEVGEVLGQSGISYGSRFGIVVRVLVARPVFWGLFTLREVREPIMSEIERVSTDCERHEA